MTLPINLTGQQNFLVASSSGRPMGARRQAVSEVISYAVDYSNWLAQGETVANIVSAVSSSAATQIVVSTLTLDGDATGVTFQLSGGLAGYKYQIELIATTSSGQVKVDTFYVTVQALPVAAPQTVTLPPSNVFVSQIKRALANGYAQLGIPANSVNAVQLTISANPSDADYIQWFDGLYVSSGDPVWVKIRDKFSLTNAQTDQLLTFAAQLAP